MIRWLLNHVSQGVAIGRAVAMMSEVDVHRESGPAPELDQLQVQLLRAIDSMDEQEVNQILSKAIRTTSIEIVVLNLIQPVLYRIGDLWEAGRLSVASEHFGTHMLRSFLAELLRQGSDPWRPYHILVGCAPSEPHDIGALVLALFLRRAGFHVVYLGANLESESLKTDLQRLSPAAICLSATTAGAARELSALYRAVAPTFDGILAYGGSAFNYNPDLRMNLPGVYLGMDVREAVATLAVALEEKTEDTRVPDSTPLPRQAT